MRTTIIAFATILLLFTNCSGDDKSRKDHKRTNKICADLYAEVFCAFGQGAFGGSRDAEWLTDSVNFRLFLGSFDEIEGGFSYKCNGDTIYVTQRPDAIAGNPKDKPVTTFYKISDLKKKQNLNDINNAGLTIYIIILGLTCVVTNLYVGFLYMKLNQVGIISSDKRVSLKILKTNLLKKDSISDQQAILKCLNVYKTFLFLFYSTLTLIIVQLFL